MQQTNDLIVLAKFSIDVNAKYRIATDIAQNGVEDLLAHVHRVELHANAMESNAYTIANRYENSLSWRVTYPIRSLHRLSVSILSKRRRAIQ